MNATMTHRNGGSTALVPFGMTFPSLTRVFTDFFNDPFFTDLMPTAEAAGPLPLDISEDETHLIVRASLPGFTREQIDVQVHEGILSISAQRSEEQESTGERYHRRERRWGSLSRQVMLPVNVVAEETEAELRDGVLTLRLPKTPESRPRKIKIA